MPLRLANAFILRTYALKESDKIVSFFTREYGKCRGVARAARRPKSKFGSTLEPLTQVRIQFFEREGKDLANIDRCELVASMLEASGADLATAMGVALMAEVADRMLPEHEVNDAVYRLLDLVLAQVREAPRAGVWAPLTYYLLWMVRLGGFLPNFASAAPEPATLKLLQAMLKQPLPGLPAEVAALAAGAPGAELRRWLKDCLQDHLEAGLRSWPLVAELEPHVDLSRPHP
jgi:DNA repair protein RecO (recombination protein O)